MEQRVAIVPSLITIDGTSDDLICASTSSQINVDRMVVGMVDKTCFLHIGCEKTGTSSIQAFLMKNRPLLQSLGYCYPTTAGGESHRFISAAFIKDPRRTGYARDLDIDEFFASFRSEINESQEDKIILSSEHLHSSLQRDDEGIELRTFLESCGFTKFGIIVYLRRQDELLIAAYSQMVKNNRTERFNFLQKMRYADYAEILRLWSSVFGASNITVKIFEDKKMLCGDVRHDFLSVLGITDTSEFIWTERLNPSLGPEALEFKRLFNTYFDSSTQIPRHAFLNAYLSEYQSNARRQVIDFETRLQILEIYRLSNEYVAREFLGGSVDELFTPPIRDDYEGKVMTELDTEKAIEICAHIWRSLSGVKV